MAQAGSGSSKVKFLKFQSCIMPSPQVLPDIAGKEEASRSVEYFRSVYDLFKSSQQVTGAIQRSFIVGGYRIRLSFSGAALLSLTRALEHLASDDDDSTPDLTICLWDSESTGQRMIARP